MSRPFAIEVNVSTGVLGVELQGFWRDADVDAYALEIRKAFHAFARRRMTFVVRVNVQHYGPQTARTQQVQGDLLQEALHAGMQRVAYVMPDSLAKQQLDRLHGRAGTQQGYFNSFEDADAWLAQHARRVMVS